MSSLRCTLAAVVSVGLVGWMAPSATGSVKSPQSQSVATEAPQASARWKPTCGFKNFSWGEAAMGAKGVTCRSAWRIVDPVTRSRNAFLSSGGDFRNWTFKSGTWRCQEAHPTFIRCLRTGGVVSWGISSGDREPQGLRLGRHCGV